MMQAGAYALLFAGALAGGFVSGLAGFGTALMALGLWLYVLPPAVAVTLTLICSVVAQTATLPSMWKSFDLSLAWPFVVGGLLGVPIGTLLIAHADPRVFKLTIGIFLLVFPIALYFSAPMAFTIGGRFADAAIGFAGGILGGLAGLSGPLPILWASVRGWGKDERRGIFQTFNWTVLFVALCLQTASGRVGREVLWFAALSLPGTVIGTWLGARLYHALDDRNFRDVVLGLLFLSGAILVWNSIGTT
jgi:uncharacterized membrane protein YfcA